MNETKTKVLNASRLIPASLLALLKQLPENAMIRTQVHAVLRWPIPDNLKTYDEIIDWVESSDGYTSLKNTVQPKLDGSAPVMPNEEEDDIPFEQPAATPARPPDTRNVEAVSAEVEYTYNEIGRCRYTQTRSGSQEYEITVGEMRDLIATAIEDECDLDWLRREIQSKAIEAAQEDPPETEGGNIDYDDYDQSDSDGHDYVITNRHVLADQVTAWVRANCTDEELEALGVSR